ncbi:restriction endonuclease [Halobellus sp. GM3]|uniref:restriction endonuclease n=1 Tax=Halobellus sp. GM3 TaxID=3458410 RepID=UPI00403DAF09
MIPELEPDEFVSFLADLWRERGWEVTVKERADETHFVVGKRGDGKRGIIYVFPTTSSTVTERHLKQFVGFCRKRGIDVAVAATQGAFAEGAQRIAAQRSVHLLDRSTLATTVEKGGFEDLLAAYTNTSRLDAAFERLRDLGVPIPEDPVPERFSGAASSVSAVIAGPIAAVGAKLGRGGSAGGPGADGGGSGDTATGSGGSDAAGGGADSTAGGGRLAGARSVASRSLPAAVVPVVLVVAFVLGATFGPAVGLGVGPSTAGDAPDVSAASTAGSNATLDVRWNARTTESLTVNGTTYDAPDGQTFLLVRMNVTNTEASPTQLDQSALAVEVAGERYAHQPLDGVTGFPSAGLFEPEETREVWTVFTVPGDAESATLLMEGDIRVRFVRDGAVTPEATVPDRE